MNLAMAAILWALVATVTGLLPYRWQIGPGLVLLASAPLLIGWIWAEAGWLPGLLALAAFLSMFRRPLVHLWRRATGRPTEAP